MPECELGLFSSPPASHYATLHLPRDLSPSQVTSPSRSLYRESSTEVKFLCRNRSRPHPPATPAWAHCHIPHDDQLDEVQQFLLPLAGGTGLVPPPRACATPVRDTPSVPRRQSWGPGDFQRPLPPNPSSLRWNGLLPIALLLDLLLLVAAPQLPYGDHPSPLPILIVHGLALTLL